VPHEIELLTLQASPAGVLRPGHRLTVPDDLSESEAQALVAGGFAREIGPARVVEEADRKAPSTAPRRRRRRTAMQPGPPETGEAGGAPARKG